MITIGLSHEIRKSYSIGAVVEKVQQQLQFDTIVTISLDINQEGIAVEVYSHYGRLMSEYNKIHYEYICIPNIDFQVLYKKNHTLIMVNFVPIEHIHILCNDQEDIEYRRI